MHAAWHTTNGGRELIMARAAKERAVTWVAGLGNHMGCGRGEAWEWEELRGARGCNPEGSPLVGVRESGGLSETQELGLPSHRPTAGTPCPQVRAQELP